MLESKFFAAVYPYNQSFTPYISYGQLVYGNIEIVQLISPSGFALDGKDGGATDKRPDTGIIVSSDFSKALNDTVNALLIPEGNYESTLYKDIVAKAKVAIENKKHILCGTILNPEDRLCLDAMCTANGVNFISSENITPNYYLRPATPTKVYRPNASVIFVGEMVEGINAKDVAVGITGYLQSQSYKVATIMDPGFSQLWGAYSNKWLFQNPDGLDDEKRILAISNFIQQLDKAEQPDVIVVQIPGGLFKYNDLYPNQFGIYAFMLSCAIRPDCFICALPYEGYTDEAIKHWSVAVQNRYGFCIDFLHISNAFKDLRNLANLKEINRVFVSQEQVDTLIKSLSVRQPPIVNALYAMADLGDAVVQLLKSFIDGTTI